MGNAIVNITYRKDFLFFICLLSFSQVFISHFLLLYSIIEGKASINHYDKDYITP
jgi:hypothetical protein